MKKGLKLFSLLVALVMVVGMFAACGSKPADTQDKVSDKPAEETPAPAEKPADNKPAVGGKVTIKWSTWGNPGEMGRFVEFTDDFNKRNPDIKAELIPVPGEYEQKILTQLAAKTAPDVFYSGDGSITKFVREKKLLELQDYMKNSATLKPDSIYENLYGAGKQGDKIYGITVDCNPMVIYYNIDLIEKAGAKTPQQYIDENKWDYEAFAELTKKIAASKKHGFIFDNWWGPVQVWFMSQGKELYAEENGNYKVNFLDPEIKKSVTFLSDLLKEKAITYSGSLPKGQGGDAMFMSGQAGMVTAGRWWVPIFKEIKTFKWDIAPYPTSFNGQTKVGIPTAYLCLNADSKNPDAAFKFMEQFLNKDGQYFRLQGGGNAVPSYKDAELDKVVLEGNLPPHAKYLLDARESGYVKQLPEQLSPEADKAMNDGLDLIWLGKVDVEKGLKDITDKMNAEFAKMKK